MFKKPLIKAGDCNIESQQVAFLISLTPIPRNLGAKIDQQIEMSSLFGLSVGEAFKEVSKAFPATCFAIENHFFCAVHSDETSRPIIFSVGVN